VNQHRDCALFPDWVPANHPARAILLHKAGKRRGGVTYKLIDREDYSENIPVWEALLQTTLIGIAEVDQGDALLFIASDGRCFGDCNISGDFFYLADSLFQFWLYRILNRRARPMLKPDEESTVLYGFTFTRENPEVYRYGNSAP
jgi:hypothetical protein